MRTAAAVVTAAMGTLGALIAGPGIAHDADHGTPEASPILAPGYGPLAFPAPKPGGYELPPLGIAANGPVLKDDGSRNTLHALFADKLVLLSFVYASCSDVNGCPLSTAVLRNVQAQLRRDPDLAPHVRMLTLSFDPVRDTPETMRRYAAPFADAAVPWSFLTTESETALRPILDAYGQSVRVELDASGQPIGSLAHVLRVFLIDAKRQIRNIYSVSFLHADTLVSDLRTLLSEPSERRPVTRAANPSTSPGDFRGGYDSKEFRTRSLSLKARAGRVGDLLARARQQPLGLPQVPVPGENPVTRDKVELGRELFFDRRLSLNDTLSCAMCHVPEQGFTSNEMATPVGIEGRSVRRNAPSLYNVGYVERLFHDGRESRLEDQIWGPLLAHNEMGNTSREALVAKLGGAADYAQLFEAAFPGEGLSAETLGMALASYERTLVSGDSAFDRWYYGKVEKALGGSAKRGFALFSGKGACAGCHGIGPDVALFSDGAFHNTGVGAIASDRAGGPTRRVQIAPGRFIEVERSVIRQVSEPVAPDLGRFEITRNPRDRWKYRTPSLRNVALSAPYMHDGSLSSLRDVVDFYDRGGHANTELDDRIRPLGLSSEEKDDLVAFLESLTGSDVDVLVADAFAAPIGERH